MSVGTIPEPQEAGKVKMWFSRESARIEKSEFRSAEKEILLKAFRRLRKGVHEFFQFSPQFFLFPAVYRSKINLVSPLSCTKIPFNADALA